MEITDHNTAHCDLFLFNSEKKKKVESFGPLLAITHNYHNYHYFEYNIKR